VSASGDRFETQMFRPELTKRVISSLMAAFCFVAGLGSLITQVQEGSVDWPLLGFPVFFVLVGWWSLRQARMRIEASETGLEIVHGFGSSHLSWQEVDRFEVAEDWRAEVVLKDGARIPLIGYRTSPMERRRSEKSPAEALVEELNRLLASRG
jgi:hypothetical protein